MGTPNMPFKILALAPFGMEQQDAWKKAPLPVELSDLDQAISTLGVSSYLSIPHDLCPAGGMEIRISRLKEFHPDELLQSNPFLSHLLAARQILSDNRLSVAEKKQHLAEWPDLPELPIKDAAKTAKAKTDGELDNILSMVAMPEDASRTPARDLSKSSNVDAIIQDVLSHVYASQPFREAEAAWQGVKLLLQQGAGANTDFRLEIVPVNTDTLEETIGALTVRLVDDLPSLILVDLPFDNTPNRLAMLEKVAQFAEILMAPAMVWVSPRLLDLDSWSDLNRLAFIPHHIEASNFAKFNRLKAQSEANWLALACNRILLRYPYGSENRPRNFPFEESGLSWVSPIWPITALIIKSFVETGWPTRFTDWQTYQIGDLAVHSIDSRTAIPTEAMISEDRLDQCRRAGLMPIAVKANRDVAFLPMETTLGGVSLTYQLFAARVTQLLLWCRDNLAPDLSGQSLEAELNRVFKYFWEKRGHTGPDELKITTDPSDEENRILLRIDLQPSRRILPSGEGLTLEFKW